MQAVKLHHDSAVVFFGTAALATLGVSIPATFALLEPFHDSWLLALFAMLVFELGAVGAKLITIAIPQWRKQLTALTVVLLLLTTIGNYLHGAELFRAAELPPTLAQLRADGYAPVLVGGSAALFPALLFIWLFAFVARIEQLTHVEQVVNRREQVVSRREQLLNSREQQIADAEQAFAQRAAELSLRERMVEQREQAPYRIEQVEYIRIASAELTWPQFEQVARRIIESKAASVSSLRRLVSSAVVEQMKEV
jgi:hypothetical protein